MIIPAIGSYILPDKLSVPLPRYAQLMGCPEPAFFGVNWTGNATYKCPTIWTQDQRLAVNFAIKEAQEDFAKKIGFDLVPTYHVNERHTCTKGSIRTDKAYLIGFGNKTIDVISNSEAVDHAADPAIIGPVASTVTDTNEVRIYHPGTDIEIIPSAVTIAGGSITIQIPKARLVLNDNNPPLGWDYTDNNLFEATVDVKREWLDPTIPAYFISSGTADLTNCDPIVTEQGCIRIMNKIMGLVLPRSFGYSLYSYFDLNYCAGLTVLEEKLERAVIGYAHTKIEVEPVDNDYLKTKWLMDRNVPSSVGTQNQDCPWGLTTGAWEAYKIARSMQVFRPGIL